MAKRQIRYAVVGLGHIAQAAVLPGFDRAHQTSKIVAFVSGTDEKRAKLGKAHGVPTYDYDDLERCLEENDVDAVYIATPNRLHVEHTIRAAKAGVHVLCEKPMATSEKDCRAMIRACDDAGVKLMIAYRLHFEEAELDAMELVRSGKIGTPRHFQSFFSYQLREGNIRARADEGGHPTWDIGVYCINAARYLFEAEPIEVTAVSTRIDDARFKESDDSVSVMMRFPGDRLATFTCSFAVAAVSSYRVVGTKGDLRVEPAYEWAEGLKYVVTINGKTKEKQYDRHDHFGQEIAYFSKCVRDDEVPEPSGWEGLADVRVVEAIEKSIASGRPVKLTPIERSQRPRKSQEVRKRASKEPALVDVEPPNAD